MSDAKPPRCPVLRELDQLRDIVAAVHRYVDEATADRAYDSGKRNRAWKAMIRELRKLPR